MATVAVLNYTSYSASAACCPICLGVSQSCLLFPLKLAQEMEWGRNVEKTGFHLVRKGIVLAATD